MLNGKRVDLTDEQLEKLGLKIKKDCCFKRNKGNIYNYIECAGTVCTDFDNSLLDEKRFEIANYCTDKSLMQQRALHEILSRLLWRFSMQNDGDKIKWNYWGQNKYFISYNYNTKKFAPDFICGKFGSILKSSTEYFYSGEIAQRAIDEIVIPFMKEHPEFVW